jgi:hypothetical protein
MLGRDRQREFLAEAAAAQRFEPLATKRPTYLWRKRLVPLGCLIPVAVMVARLFAA